MNTNDKYGLVPKIIYGWENTSLKVMELYSQDQELIATLNASDFETAVSTTTYTSAVIGNSLQTSFLSAITNEYENDSGVNKTLTQYGWNGIFDVFFYCFLSRLWDGFCTHF